jgi:hypothetical protein
MNYEVWLMLLGFNLDFWEQHNIEHAMLSLVNYWLGRKIPITWPELLLRPE